MTPPPEAEAYPDIDPALYQSPFPAPGPRFSPTINKTSPLGTVGCPSQFPSPEGAGAGGGASSLVQYNSITSTVPNPSDIAKASFEHFNKNDVDYKLCYHFVDYLDKCEQKGFLIRGYDTVRGKFVHCRLPYENRWAPGRRKELSEKLKRLEYWFELQSDRPVTMITLTSYQKKWLEKGKIRYGYNDVSIQGAWHDLNVGRGKLLKLIAKYFPGTDYFWVVEPHQSGYVHYHLAVFADISNEVKDNKGKGIEDKFRDLWSKKWKIGSHTYGLDFSHKKNKDDKIQHLKNYLSKYLEKGFLMNKWTSGMLKFNANLWDSGFRMYGASTAIRKMMNIEGDNQQHETRYYFAESDKKTDGINDDLGPGYAELYSYRLGHDVVWLQMKIEDEHGDEYTIHGHGRAYIPDWIDSDVWLDPGGKILTKEAYPKYIYDWGRGPHEPMGIKSQEKWEESLPTPKENKNVVSCKVTHWQNMNIPKRKKEIDPYEQFNKDHAESCAPSGLRQGSAPRDKYGLL